MSENITVELDLDDSKFTSKIKQSTKSLKDFEGALKSVATSHRKMADAAQASAGRLGSLSITLSRVHSDVQKLNSSLQRSLLLQKNVVASFSSSANSLLTINRSIETSFSQQAKAVADFNRMTIAARKSERSLNIAGIRGKKVGSPLQGREDSLPSLLSNTSPHIAAINSMQNARQLQFISSSLARGDTRGVPVADNDKIPEIISSLGKLAAVSRIKAAQYAGETASGLADFVKESELLWKEGEKSFQKLVRDGQGDFRTLEKASPFVDFTNEQMPVISEEIQKLSDQVNLEKEKLSAKEEAVKNHIRESEEKGLKPLVSYVDSAKHDKVNLKTLQNRLQALIDTKNGYSRIVSFYNEVYQHAERRTHDQYLVDSDAGLRSQIEATNKAANDQLMKLKSDFDKNSADYSSEGKDPSSLKTNYGHDVGGVYLKLAETSLGIYQRARATEKLKLDPRLNRDNPLSTAEKQKINDTIWGLDQQIKVQKSAISELKQRLNELKGLPSTPSVPASVEEPPASYTPRSASAGVPSVPRRQPPEPEEPPKTPFQRQMEEWANIGQNFNLAMTGWLDNSVDALANFITTGKADFSGLINSMIKDITKLALKWTMSKVMSGLGGDKSEASGKAATAKTGSKGVPIPTPKPFPLAHTGGIIGASNLVRRSINPAAFLGAPRFHTGGIIKGLGIGPGEVPIIAKKGEGVFTPEQMKALGGVANSNVSQLNPVSINNEITVNGSGGTPEQNQDLAKKMSRELESSMRQTVIKELRNQQRPGGIIAA
jgi:hypothetical protein